VHVRLQLRCRNDGSINYALGGAQLWDVGDDSTLDWFDSYLHFICGGTPNVTSGSTTECMQPVG